MEEVLQRIKNFIANGDLTAALNEVEVLGDSVWSNEAILLKNRFHEISKRERQNSLSFSEISIEKSKISAAILQICDLAKKASPSGIDDRQDYLKNNYKFNSKAGQIIDNKYQLLSFIGSGGFGEVYKAKHLFLDKAIAIKLIYPFEDHTGSIKQLIEYALKSLVSVGNHPYVITVLDAGTFIDHGTERYFIVSELIPGGDLRAYIEREIINATHELKKRLEVFEKVCQGVHHCHVSTSNRHGFQTYGVYHGDIKPENILLRNDNEPVLTDFMFIDFDRIVEISKTNNAAFIPDDGATTIVGTGKYMSQEQKTEGIVSRKTEIYSLGVLLADLINNIDFVPDELRLIIQKATHIDPRQRFEEVEELRLNVLDIIDNI